MSLKENSYSNFREIINIICCAYVHLNYLIITKVFTTCFDSLKEEMKNIGFWAGN